MTTSIIHTQAQEDAIKHFKRRYNLANGTSLTNGQYADLRVLEFFDGMVAAHLSEKQTAADVADAYRSANQSTKDQVNVLLGL